MNYPPLMQQLPPMPMGSNYPSGPHEAASVQSGGPPNQYSPVMHGIPQSVSQGNYMLQSNAAAPPTLPTNNNLCNDFVSKPPQRCSNMAMVQGGCINTNMNSMHQTAPNYSNMNGVSWLKFTYHLQQTFHRLGKVSTVYLFIWLCWNSYLFLERSYLYQHIIVIAERTTKTLCMYSTSRAKWLCNISSYLPVWK